MIAEVRAAGVATLSGIAKALTALRGRVPTLDRPAAAWLPKRPSDPFGQGIVTSGGTLGG